MIARRALARAAGKAGPTSPSSSALRIGGNQRIASNLTSLLSSAPRVTPYHPAVSTPPSSLLLRSQFSTSTHRWAGEPKPTPEAEKEPTSESKSEEKPEDQKTEEEKAEEAKKKAPPPPPPPKHGDKSPLAVFMETLQVEFKKSQEWQESTKQLAGSVEQFSESPAVKRAREVSSKTAEVAEKVGGKTAEALGKTASAVGKGAVWTWNTPVVKAGRVVTKKVADGVDTVTKPVRETKVYKEVSGNIKEVIDDGSSSRYGGYLEREERKRLRELREARGEVKKFEKFEEDPEYVVQPTPSLTIS